MIQRPIGKRGLILFRAQFHHHSESIANGRTLGGQGAKDVQPLFNAVLHGQDDGNVPVVAGDYQVTLNSAGKRMTQAARLTERAPEDSPRPNRFRVFYRVQAEAIIILALGEKLGNRLFIEGEEVEP